MEHTDHYIQHAGVSGSIRYADALTQNAVANSEYEAHVHHDDFEIYWFLDGKLSFAFEGDRIAIQPGDMVILCNNLLHRPIIQGLAVITGNGSSFKRRPSSDQEKADIPFNSFYWESGR